jgi:hypothetical protein
MGGKPEHRACPQMELAPTLIVHTFNRCGRTVGLRKTERYNTVDELNRRDTTHMENTAVTTKRPHQQMIYPSQKIAELLCENKGLREVNDVLRDEVRRLRQTADKVRNDLDGLFVEFAKFRSYAANIKQDLNDVLAWQVADAMNEKGVEDNPLPIR